MSSKVGFNYGPEGYKGDLNQFLRDLKKLHGMYLKNSPYAEKLIKARDLDKLSKWLGKNAFWIVGVLGILGFLTASVFAAWGVSTLFALIGVLAFGKQVSGIAAEKAKEESERYKKSTTDASGRVHDFFDAVSDELDVDVGKFAVPGFPRKCAGYSVTDFGISDVLEVEHDSAFTSGKTSYEKAQAHVLHVECAQQNKDIWLASFVELTEGLSDSKVERQKSTPELYAFVPNSDGGYDDPIANELINWATESNRGYTTYNVPCDDDALSCLFNFHEKQVERGKAGQKAHVRSRKKGPSGSGSSH